jgi:predicted nucleic acid-binding protein
MSSFGVVLDAATLFPFYLRDTLLQTAENGLYRLFWTDQILEEVRRNLIKMDKMKEEQANRLIDIMKMAFPEAKVKTSKYKKFISKMQNDRKDRHVLAAAVACGAQVIVTPNVKHFRPEALEPWDIQAQTPDEFLLYQFDLSRELMLNVLKNQAAAYKAPPLTIQELLALLKNSNVLNFALVVEDYIKNLPSTPFAI